MHVCSFNCSSCHTYIYFTAHHTVSSHRGWGLQRMKLLTNRARDPTIPEATIKCADEDGVSQRLLYDPLAEMTVHIPFSSTFHSNVPTSIRYSPGPTRLSSPMSCGESWIQFEPLSTPLCVPSSKVVTVYSNLNL